MNSSSRFSGPFAARAAILSTNRGGEIRTHGFRVPNTAVWPLTYSPVCARLDLNQHVRIERRPLKTVRLPFRHERRPYRADGEVRTHCLHATSVVLIRMSFDGTTGSVGIEPTLRALETRTSP